MPHEEMGRVTVGLVVGWGICVKRLPQVKCRSSTLFLLTLFWVL